MSEPRTLYVVTSGCYSDYGVVAIFDDRDLAERYCEGSDDSGGYGMRVEEYPLNPKAEEIRAGLKGHRVLLDRDGNLVRHDEDYGLDPEPGEVDWQYAGGPDYRRVYVFGATVLAKTKEQAVKAVNEQRAQWLAAGNAWPTDR